MPKEKASNIAKSARGCSFIKTLLPLPAAVEYSISCLCLTYSGNCVQNSELHLKHSQKNFLSIHTQVRHLTNGVKWYKALWCSLGLSSKPWIKHVCFFWDFLKTIWHIIALYLTHLYCIHIYYCFLYLHLLPFPVCQKVFISIIYY